MVRRPPQVQIILYLLLAMVIIAFMVPIIWVFLLSIRPAVTNRTIPPTLIFKPTLKFYRYCFVQPGVSRNYLISSLIISTAATGLSLPFSISAAYAFSRFRFRARRFLIFYYLSLFFGPPVVFLIPFFVIMAKIGWVGSYQSMIFIYQTFTIPFSVLIMKSFFDEVPPTLEDAAMVDGASRIKALFKVILPISLPGIIVSAMFAFVFSWNNAIYPIVLSARNTKPLPVGTLDFFATTGVTWNNIGATSMVTIVPPMIIFLLLGKYIVRGLTFGAVKG
jgi:multiple sugar transport system permease protein